MSVSVTAETSSRRAESNRNNARMSTGPRTAEGKSGVSLNALKHGLTAATVVLPGENAEALQERVEAWKDDLRPRGAVEDYLVERAAVVSWQVDRADRIIAARLTELMRYGPADRAVEDADEVADLARRLYWNPRGPLAVYPHSQGFRPTPRISWPDSVEDPLNPERIVNRLEATAGGCRWLLDRWGDLRKLLEDGLKWQAPDRLKAIRMLGRQPMDAPDDERVLSIYLACDAMDPGAPTSFKDLATELATDEAEAFGERVQGRDARGRKPADAAAGKAVLLAIAARATERLEALLCARRERQAAGLPGRLDGLAFDDSDDGERLRRYQLAHARSLISTINAIFKVRKEAADRDEETSGSAVDAPPAALEP